LIPESAEIPKYRGGRHKSLKKLASAKEIEGFEFGFRSAGFGFCSARLGFRVHSARTRSASRKMGLDSG
jgi:hypothetical protein